MSKTLGHRLTAMQQGIQGHVRGYFRAEEQLSEALAGTWKEVRRFGQHVTGTAPDLNRKHAIKYVKQGVEHYNKKAWGEAERLFHKALSHDEGYSRAWTYLGNTCYQKGRLTEAVTAWNRAIEAEPRSDAADTAREKLLTVGHGADGLLASIKEQMRAR